VWTPALCEAVGRLCCHDLDRFGFHRKLEA